MLPNPLCQQPRPVLAVSSRLIMIDSSRLKEASVVAVMNGDAGDDTTVNVTIHSSVAHAWLALG